MYKVCTACKETKLTICFGRDRKTKDQLSYNCKDCNKARVQEYCNKNKERVKEYKKKYHALNREKIAQKAKINQQKNAESIKSYLRDYYQRNKEEASIKNKVYYAENKEKIIKRNGEYRDSRLKCDPIFRMKENLRSRVRNAIRNNYKSQSTFDLVGCSIDFLKAYLEEQFTEGMSWDNYGKWHIDHIKPCASFDLSQEDEQKKCFHYSNLQPLWAVDNLKKGASIPLS